jgi:hypothetical protein
LQQDKHKQENHTSGDTMRKRVRLRVTSVLVATTALVLLTALPAGAGEENAGTFGAPSLKIPVGAKLMSAPDVLAGMEPDASLLFSNPAFVSGIPAPQVFLSTSNWLEDMRLSAMSFAVPVTDWGMAFSAGATLLYSGDLKGYDEALNVVSEDSYYDMAITGALVKQIRSVGLSFSAGGTWLRQHLYPTDGSGFAFTGGVVYQKGANTAHFVAKNLGGTVEFSGTEYDIDSENIAGYGRTFETGMGSVMAGVQVVNSSAAPNRVELGLGYRFNRLFTIRTSMRDVTDSRSEGLAVDAGFSVRYNQLSIDYAYTPHEYFSSTHTFSMAFTFRGSSGGAGQLMDSEQSQSTSRSGSRQADNPPANAAVRVEPAPKPVVSVNPAASEVFLLVTGTYSWEEGALDEVRTLELRGYSATVENVNNRYLVVLGRYQDRQKADAALRELEQEGHSIRIVAIGP